MNEIEIAALQKQLADARKETEKWEWAHQKEFERNNEFGQALRGCTAQLDGPWQDLPQAVERLLAERDTLKREKASLAAEVKMLRDTMPLCACGHSFSEHRGRGTHGSYMECSASGCVCGYPETVGQKQALALLNKHTQSCPLLHEERNSLSPVRKAKKKADGTLSAGLREAIDSMPVSRHRLALTAGVPESAISRFMTDGLGLRMVTVDKLAQALGLELVQGESKVKKGKK